MSENSADKTSSAAEERNLIHRIADGDGEALGELYDRYSPLLLGLARRILRRDGDAEEVLQEVMLQVWKQAHRYEKSRSAVTTWLVLLTRSRAIDRLRSQRSRDRTLDAYQVETPVQKHASATASGTVLMNERRERLSTALADLPEEQRQVLELAFYSGLSQSEIAAAIDIPLGTVKTRTLLAMRKLRKALEGEMKELL
ncbi:MAG: sigma-70 family RNA polymerase sigma factor [Acidobacteriota bacterium]|nr:sigma-70 family RNA polymerase sigma factor [Acidobacteriota bacterium]